MGTVVIGCKLPHGIQFVGIDGKKHHIAGKNRALIAGGHGITTIDEDVAKAFFADHAEQAYIRNQSIFMHGDAASVADIAAELKDEKTGLEGIDPANPGVGIKATLEDSPEQAAKKIAEMEAKASAMPSRAPAPPKPPKAGK